MVILNAEVSFPCRLYRFVSIVREKVGILGEFNLISVDIFIQSFKDLVRSVPVSMGGNFQYAPPVISLFLFCVVTMSFSMVALHQSFHLVL